MHTGERIREIRKSMGLSLENIAHATGASVSTISRIERGAECDPETLKAIKKALSIEGAPLTDEEAAAFRARYSIWGGLLTDRRIDDAHNLGDELAVILKLPYEKDLIMLHKLYEINHLQTIGKYDAVEIGLAGLEKSLDEMSPEHLCRYYGTKSALLFRREEYEESMRYKLKMFELKDHISSNHASIYYSMAVGYSCLNRPFSALLYLEDARRLHNDHDLSVLGLFIDHVTAKHYLSIGELARAKPLLDKALQRAEGIGRKLGRRKYIGMILHLIGIYHQENGGDEEALRFFNRADEYFYVGGLDHLENIYYKTRSLITQKNFAKAKELLTHAKDTAAHNEKFTIVYKALSHVISLRENESRQYLKSTAIPYLVSKHEYFMALYFCGHLEEQYKKTGNSKKSLEVSAVARDVYAKIIFGE